MKVFVTGATGFIGSACADALQRAGHVVVRGCRALPQRAGHDDGWTAYGDLTASPDWPRLLAGCDAVLHCAGIASVDAYDRDDATTQAVTVEALSRLVKGAARAGVRRIVLMSSALVAGPPSRYATTKLAAEQRLQAAASEAGLEWVVLRPPLVYGPGCGGNFRRLEKLVRLRVPLPFGAATAPRSFVAIANLASAATAAVAHTAAAGQTFFVCDDGDTSTAGLIRCVADSLALSPRLVPVPAALFGAIGRITGREREVASLFAPFVVDGAPIKAALGWQPPVSFRDGVRAAVASSAAALVAATPSDHPANPPSKAAERRRKLCFVATEDWFVHSHFLPMLRQARDMGLEVVVLCRVNRHRAELEAEGVRVVAIEAERSSLAPRQLVGNWLALVATLRRERPDVMHGVSLRVVMLGGLAARAARVPRLILAPVGLGHIWVSNGWRERLIRRAIRWTVPTLLARPGTVFLFENREDPRELGLDKDSPAVAIVPGAGVDAREFTPAIEPAAQPVKVAVVARMTVAKGIIQSIAAVQRARARGGDIELHLFGQSDPSNRGALGEEALSRLGAEAGIVWHGPTGDVPGVWRTHHIAMLLSEREGLPRSLVEAAACGRPIVATDVTGCREVVRPGIDGYLVAPGDIEGTADALLRLAHDAGLRQRMGAAAREHFEQRFTDRAVSARMSEIYARAVES